MSFSRVLAFFINLGILLGQVATAPISGREDAASCGPAVAGDFLHELSVDIHSWKPTLNGSLLRSEPTIAILLMCRGRSKRMKAGSPLTTMKSAHKPTTKSVPTRLQLDETQGKLHNVPAQEVPQVFESKIAWILAMGRQGMKKHSLFSYTAYFNSEILGIALFSTKNIAHVQQKGLTLTEPQNTRPAKRGEQTLVDPTSKLFSFSKERVFRIQNLEMLPEVSQSSLPGFQLYN